MRKKKLRTYPIKSLTIFLSVCFVVSVGMLVLFSFLRNEPWVIRILIWLFCGIFASASGIVLFYQIFFYVEVNEKYFIRHFFPGSHKIPLEKVEKIKNIDGFYYVYVNGVKIASFSTNTKESQEIILFLEKSGVKIEW